MNQKWKTQEAIICVSRYMPPELIFINPRKFNELVSTAAKTYFSAESRKTVLTIFITPQV